MLTAEENVLLPLSIAGQKPRQGVDRGAASPRRPRRAAEATAPRSSPAGSSSGSPSPARSSRVRRSSSPTSRPATSTRAPARRSSISSARPSRTSARPSSWSRTTSGRRPSPTGSCTSPTAGSSRTSAPSTAAEVHRGRRGGEPAMTVGRAQGPCGAQAPRPSHRASPSCSASRWSAAPMSSRTRSRAAFDQIFAGSYRNTAAVITGKLRRRRSRRAARRRCPSRCSQRCRSLPDVETAAGQIFNLNDSSDLGKLIGRDGKPLGSSGNPTFAFGLDPDARQAQPAHAHERAAGRPGRARS